MAGTRPPTTHPPREPLVPSTYAERASDLDASPLTGDSRVSVAVVGGGYTGLSTALHLREAGIDVAVLEANEIGWGCSGRNGGQVNPGLKPDPDEVERDFGTDLGRRMVALSYSGPDRVFDLIRRHDIACFAQQTGTLRLAINAPSARQTAALVEQCLARGMPVEHLDEKGVAAATGTERYRSALRDRRGGSVDPLAYARGLARAAAALGARLHPGTRALSVERGGGGWRIRTSGGSVTAERLVIATNGYTDDLWPDLRRTIVPVYSAIAATEPLPPAIASTIMPTRSVGYEVGWDTVYYRVDENGRLLMGGRGPQRQARGDADYAHLKRYAERLWPALKGLAWTHHWAGQVAVTTDHYPHLYEPAQNVHLALGYNGRGIAMATTMGALVARRIAGASRDEIDFPVTDRLEPIRFHDFWPIGVALRVIYGRWRDRLAI